MQHAISFPPQVRSVTLDRRLWPWPCTSRAEHVPCRPAPPGALWCWARTVASRKFFEVIVASAEDGCYTFTMRTSSFDLESDGDARSGHVRSVVRALTMLSALVPGRSTVTELASAAELPVPTAIRILKTLEASGYISRDADGSYLYGPAAIWMAVKLDPRGAISHAIRLATQDLSTKFNETVAFFMRDRNERVCVESAESTREVRWVCRQGQRMPVHLGAAGHILIAYGTPEAEAPEFAAIGSSAYASLQIVAIRQMGYATTELESTNDSWGIAAPVFEEGVFYGALACGIPLSRATDELRGQVTQACLAAAKAASSGPQHDNYATRTMTSTKTP